jgi:hypothetical protein
MTEVIVVPKTGEVLDITGATTTSLAAVIEAINEAEKDLKSDRRQIGDELARRLDIEGRRSVMLDDFRIEVSPPTEKTWDVDELRATLAELVEEGTISDGKAKACVKWTPEPVWAELKTLLSDPRCKARITHCFEENAKTRYVRVKRVRG